MNRRFSFISLAAFTFIAFFSLSNHAVQMPQPQQMMPGGPAPKLSDDDMKMLQEVEQEINKFVTSLPADEQKKFWQDVDELTKVMSTMNEDELVKFMENVLTEQEPTLPAIQPQMQQPAPYIPTYQPPMALPEKQPEVAPVISKETEKQQKAQKLIEAIILMLNNFLTKAQAIPDLPGKIESWIKEGKVKATPGSTWNSIRTNIEQLISKLNIIKDRDPATGQAKYLDELIKDESLLNALSRLKDVLTRHEPNIDISPFGVEKMSHTTRESMRSIINMVIEATTVLAIPAALDKIIASYEPTAKKMREKEEAAQRQAFEASRRPGYMTPAIVAGRPEREEYRPSGKDYGKFFGEAPYKPAPIPGATKEKQPEEKKEKSEEQKKGAAGAEKGKAEKEKKEPEKPLDAEDKKAGEFYDTFEKNLFEATGRIEDNLKVMLNPPGKADKDVEGEIKSAAQGIRTATSSLKQLKRRVKQLESTKPNLKSQAKKLMQQELRNNEELFGKMPKSGTGVYAESINELLEKVKGLRDYIAEF